MYGVRSLEFLHILKQTRYVISLFTKKNLDFHLLKPKEYNDLDNEKTEIIVSSM